MPPPSEVVSCRPRLASASNRPLTPLWRVAERAQSSVQAFTILACDRPLADAHTRVRQPITSPQSAFEITPVRERVRGGPKEKTSIPCPLTPAYAPIPETT